MSPDKHAAVKVFLVDDHPVILRALSSYLEETADATLCGVATSGEEALNVLDPQQSDLVLLDVSLNGMSGIELLGEIHSRWPELPCLMYSGHGEHSYVRRAMGAGARGYVLKGNPAELADAIDTVLTKGKTYLSPGLDGTAH